MPGSAVRLLLSVFVLAMGGCAEGPSTEPGDRLYLPEDDSRCMSVVVEEEVLTLAFDVDATEIGLFEGQLVAGRAQGGYLREITELALSASEATLVTSRASLAEAVVTGSMHETMALDGAWALAEDEGARGTRGELVLDGLVLFDGYSNVAELSVQVVEGSLSFDPELLLDVEVQGSELTRLEFRITGDLALQMTAEISLAAPYSYTTEQVVASYTLPISTRMGDVPVEGVLTAELWGGLEVTAVDGGSMLGSVLLESEVDIGGAYADGEWAGIWSTETEASAPTEPEWITDDKLAARVWLRPVFSVRLHGMDGPSGGVEPFLGGSLTGLVPLEWTLTAGLSGGVDIPMGVFSEHVEDYAHDTDDEGEVVAIEVPAEGYAEVTSGEAFSCGLMFDGSVVCWGDNTDGQATPPEGVFTQVRAGASHACALDLDGAVNCWGKAQAIENTPVAGQFQLLAAGADFTCGLRDEGTLRCWGANEFEQGTAPVGIYTRVAAGEYHACALDLDGRASCWGLDDAGQSTPLQTAFTALGGGRNFTCGLDAASELRCWGCLDGDTAACEPPAGAFVQLSATSTHACAVRQDEQVLCWGSVDGGGALSSPADAFTNVGAGGHHACGVETNAEIVCWGDDNLGQCTPPQYP